MENLKNALKTIINVSEITSEALDDGKISVIEGANIAFAAVGFVGVIKTIPEIIAEYKALSDEQITELTEWFSEEFDITNNHIEEIIETVFEALLNLNAVFNVL